MCAAHVPIGGTLLRSVWGQVAPATQAVPICAQEDTSAVTGLPTWCTRFSHTNCSPAFTICNILRGEASTGSFTNSGRMPCRVCIQPFLYVLDVYPAPRFPVNAVKNGFSISTTKNPPSRRSGGFRVRVAPTLKLKTISMQICSREQGPEANFHLLVQVQTA